MDPEYSQPTPQIQAALWNIRVDAATAEVVRSLAEAGVDSVVLKGGALRDWYPSDSVRTYIDGDIWIPADREDAANAVLSALGFEPEVSAEDLPQDWSEHGMEWLRASDRAAIDLHKKLQGVRLDAVSTWALLWPTTEPIDIGGGAVRRLSEPARALYVSLHAAGHGANYPRAQRHLEAALLHLGSSTWREAAELSVVLDADEMFSAGLRLLPAGAELADELGLAVPTSVKATLYSMTPPPVALGFEQLSSAARFDRRIVLLLRKFFPGARFIRHWWPPARRNRAMLFVGYLYRPIWLLARAPAGFRAWRTAGRRAAAAQRRDNSSS